MGKYPESLLKNTKCFSGAFSFNRHLIRFLQHFLEEVVSDKTERTYYYNDSQNYRNKNIWNKKAAQVAYRKCWAPAPQYHIEVMTLWASKSCLNSQYLYNFLMKTLCNSLFVWFT